MSMGAVGGVAEGMLRGVGKGDGDGERGWWGERQGDWCAVAEARLLPLLGRTHAGMPSLPSVWPGSVRGRLRAPPAATAPTLPLTLKRPPRWW